MAKTTGQYPSDVPAMLCDGCHGMRTQPGEKGLRRICEMCGGSGRLTRPHRELTDREQVIDEYRGAWRLWWTGSGAWADVEAARVAFEALR